MGRPPATIDPEELTPAEIERAAAQLGLKTIKVPTIIATGVMGRHLEQVGVKRYAHGLFLHSADQMVSAMNALSEDIETTDDPELKMRKQELLHRYAKSLAETAEAMVETGDVEAHKRTDRPTLDAPSAPPAPVLIQNTVTVSPGSEIKVERTVNGRSVDVQTP